MRLLAQVSLIGTCGILATAHAQGAPQAASSPFTQIRWLAGCWEMRQGQAVTIEMWMPIEGNLVLGGSRTLVNGRAREFDQYRLTVEGNQLVYTSKPSGQTETVFRSTSVSESGFTLENPQHDFPTKILYRRHGADSLIARIEGPGKNGTKGIDFPMKRVSCTL